MVIISPKATITDRFNLASVYQTLRRGCLIGDPPELITFKLIAQQQFLWLPWGEKQLST